MAWDSSRPVPWRRLIREWLIYAAIMVVIFLLFFRDQGAIGAIVGVLVSGPLYLMLGYALAKFGYQRRTMRELREARAPSAAAAGHAPAEAAPRPRPAPTRRTSTGPSNRPSGSKRKR